MAELPLAVYCPQCGAYVLLLGAADFQCDQCGGVFEVTAEPQRRLEEETGDSP